MPRTAENKDLLLKELIKEQAREQKQRVVYPEIVLPRPRALFELLTDNQIAAIVLGRLIGPKKTAGILDISVSGIEKHIERGKQKLSTEQRVKLGNALKIISAMN